MLAAPVARGKIVAEVQGVALGPSCPGPIAAQKIVHDIQYYILEAQNSERASGIYSPPDPMKLGLAYSVIMPWDS